MIYGYARVSTDGQSVAAQVGALRKHGAGKVFREVATGAKTDRAQLRRLLDQLDAGDVLMVTRLDRLARSTRDLLNTLAAITGKAAGFRSLGDAWADTTTAHGRLMLTILGGLAEFDPRPHQRRPRARQGSRRQTRPETQAH
jgi:DNA invertase Pin-like site-specific DNA recombinase